MIIFPHCKINIGLFVTGKREDGYHTIESIFFPVIRCNDILEVIPSADDRFYFSTSGSSISGRVEDNSCYQAWTLVRRIKPIAGVHCHLHKIIPTGAGLGGGSADGAWMLKALNDLFALALSVSELKSLALQLGSDCPFFIDAQPSFVTGRGECLSPIPLNLQGIWIVIVHPQIHIQTADAYREICPSPARFKLSNICDLPFDKWQESISNDFENIVIQKYPEIGDIKNKLMAMGAFFASLSGSGSAVFGLFHNEPVIEHSFATFFCKKIRL